MLFTKIALAVFVMLRLIKQDSLLPIPSPAEVIFPRVPVVFSLRNEQILSSGNNS